MTGWHYFLKIALILYHHHSDQSILRVATTMPQANSPEELPEALLGAVRLNGFGVEDSSLQTKLFPT